MQFDEVLTHVVELLQRQGWVAYRALKLRIIQDDPIDNIFLISWLMAKPF